MCLLQIKILKFSFILNFHILNKEAGKEVFELCLDIGRLQAAHRDPYKLFKTW